MWRYKWTQLINDDWLMINYMELYTTQPGLSQSINANPMNEPLKRHDRGFCSLLRWWMDYSSIYPQQAVSDTSIQLLQYRQVHQTI